MEERLQRTALLIGDDSINKLKKAHVAVFGIGGVGGFVCEALARSGVGELTLVDKDVVSESNINRQIIALYSTVGMYKTEIMAQRIRDINPDCIVHCHNKFFLPDCANDFDFSQYDYVVDAVDNVTAKIELVMQCEKAGTKIICAMGTGNKLDANSFVITDIYKTTSCPLARVMRRELRARNIKRLKVIYSTADIIKPKADENGNIVTASISYVPSVAGLLLAGEVIKDLTMQTNTENIK